MVSRFPWLIAACVAAAGAFTSCGDPLDLGTDVVWSTDFERGDLSALQASPGTGGTFNERAGPSDAAIVVSREQAHSGHFAAKFTSVASFASPTFINGSGLFKEASFPQGAYYSAWYFIPKYHQTISGWNILKMEVPVVAATASRSDASTGDAGAPGLSDADVDPQTSTGSAAQLLDLSLESLPPGRNMALVLSDSRHMYLTSPLPAKVPFVPIGRWFQIECYYKNVPTSDGEFTVWLDGVQVYDVVRPMSSNPLVHFMPCSLVDDMIPSDATLFVDDVAVSWSRVTPGGVLTVPH